MNYKKYAAYGSNMGLDEMAERCPNSHVHKTGIIRGWKLIFRSVADIQHTGKAEDFVPVVVWDIAEQDWEALDNYEGYPRLYDKVSVDAETDGEVIQTVVYIMTDDFSKRVAMPPKNYFNRILQGYRDNGIDEAPLHEAFQETRDIVCGVRR